MARGSHTTRQSMPRTPDPVGIPKTAPVTYERELRRNLTDPIIMRLRQSLLELSRRPEGVVLADLVRQRIEADINAAVRNLNEIAANAAVGHVGRVGKWHRRRLLATFRKVGMDLEPLMSEDAVRAALNARIRDNVRLIKTIPQRMHGSLMRRLQKQAEAGWRFDPGFTKRLLRAEYKSSGYNLRRLTRDQTTKQLSQMTMIRHQQAGFRRYTWVTGGSGPNRREDHQANEGQVFAWMEPPATGHPGEAIQCMCQAAPHVEDSDIELAASLFS